jgi:hypothetical protein
MKIGRLSEDTTNRLREQVEAVITSGSAGKPYEDLSTFNVTKARPAKKGRKSKHLVREYYLKDSSIDAAQRLDSPAFAPWGDNNEATDDSCICDSAVFPDALARWVNEFKRANKASLQSLAPEHAPGDYMTLAAVKQHWGGQPVTWKHLLHQNEGHIGRRVNICVTLRGERSVMFYHDRVPLGRPSNGRTKKTTERDEGAGELKLGAGDIYVGLTPFWHASRFDQPQWENYVDEENSVLAISFSVALKKPWVGVPFPTGSEAEDIVGKLALLHWEVPGAENSSSTPPASSSSSPSPPSAPTPPSSSSSSTPPASSSSSSSPSSAPTPQSSSSLSSSSKRIQLIAGDTVFYWDPTMTAGDPSAKRYAQITEVASRADRGAECLPIKLSDHAERSLVAVPGGCQLQIHEARNGRPPPAGGWPMAKWTTYDCVPGKLAVSEVETDGREELACSYHETRARLTALGGEEFLRPSLIPQTVISWVELSEASFTAAAEKKHSHVNHPSAEEIQGQEVAEWLERYRDSETIDTVSIQEIEQLDELRSRGISQDFVSNTSVAA